MYKISFKERKDSYISVFTICDSSFAYRFIEFLAEAYERGDIAWFDFRPLEVIK